MTERFNKYKFFSSIMSKNVVFVPTSLALT